MFEEENDQNGTQFNGQPGSLSQYGNMFASLQPTSGDNGDFRNLPLRLDPNTGVASRMPAAFSGATAAGQSASAQGTPGQTAVTQSSPGQTATGQTTTGQNPTSLPPIQPRDDQGKTLPKYRMGIGQRILGTVANFANGFARNGASPVYVGPGALNNRYYQDEELRQQQNRQKSPNTVPVPASGTQPGSDGSEATPGILPTTFNGQPPIRQTPARLRLAQFQAGKIPNGRIYRHTAVNPQTGQRVASNDGTTWHSIDGSGSTRA